MAVPKKRISKSKKKNRKTLWKNRVARKFLKNQMFFKFFLRSEKNFFE